MTPEIKRDIDKQAQNVVQLLLALKKKVASAESCTGGLISAAITSVSGSSEVFDMGICTYANKVKHDKINVPSEYLERFGAVSEQVAKAMAEGVAEAAESDFGVSTTEGCPEEMTEREYIRSQAVLAALKLLESELIPNPF